MSLGCLPAEPGLYRKDTGTGRTLLAEINASLQRRISLSDGRLHILAIAGAGASYLHRQLYPGVMIGTGADLRISPLARIQLSAAYLVNNTLSNGARVQLGLFGTLKKRKPPITRATFVSAPAASDMDNDGVPDEADLCPQVAGLPGFQGCPDTDLDGIPDNRDSCVLIPGFIENNGCPLAQTAPEKMIRDSVGTQSVQHVTALINLLAKNIEFPNNEYYLQPAAQPYLAQIAYALGRVKFDTLYITGYTDNVGSTADNQLLSERRAASVKTALAALGVPLGKMMLSGKGENDPIATNHTNGGRQANRRTEFRIQASRTVR